MNYPSTILTIVPEHEETLCDNDGLMLVAAPVSNKCKIFSAEEQLLIDLLSLIMVDNVVKKQRSL